MIGDALRQRQQAIDAGRRCAISRDGAQFLLQLVETTRREMAEQADVGIDEIPFCRIEESPHIIGPCLITRCHQRGDDDRASPIPVPWGDRD